MSREEAEEPVVLVHRSETIEYWQEVPLSSLDERLGAGVAAKVRDSPAGDWQDVLDRALEDAPAEVWDWIEQYGATTERDTSWFIANTRCTSCGAIIYRDGDIWRVTAGGWHHGNGSLHTSGPLWVG